MHNKRCGQKSKKIKNLIGRIVKTRWNVTFQISNDFNIEIQISLFRNRKQVICPIVGLFRNPSHRQIFGILPLYCSYYREYIHGVGRGRKLKNPLLWWFESLKTKTTVRFKIISISNVRIDLMMRKECDFHNNNYIILKIPELLLRINTFVLFLQYFQIPNFFFTLALILFFWFQLHGFRINYLFSRIYESIGKYE